MAGRQDTRLVALVLARCALAVTLLLFVYYKAPLDQRIDVLSGVEFLVGLLAFAGVAYWQIRAVVDSDTPRLRATQAVAVGLPLLLTLFAAAYVWLDNSSPQPFTQPLSRTDSLYFTLTVFTTVGFGDITPVTEIARILTMIQMVVGLVAVGVLARLLLGAVQMAVQRRDGVSGAAEGSGNDATVASATRRTDAVHRGGATDGE
jgi:voltage-gated potassium channel